MCIYAREQDHSVGVNQKIEALFLLRKTLKKSFEIMQKFTLKSDLQPPPPLVKLKSIIPTTLLVQAPVFWYFASFSMAVGYKLNIVVLKKKWLNSI